MGEVRNAYNILDVKPEGKRPLERPKHRWEGDVRMGWWEGTDWIHVAQNRN
jgi:hypothetical protein